jgi:predicted DNA-binding transcriptional regulator AlpA
MESNAPALLLSADAAAMLGIKPQTLRKWRLTGTGPRYVRLGGPLGRVAYRQSEIDAWLSARTFASTADETVRS